MAKPTINIPEEMNDRIESDLSYGDSKSEWIRNSIEFKILVDDLLGESYSHEEKLDLLKNAINSYDLNSETSE